jgi:hypothetical protein
MNEQVQYQDTPLKTFVIIWLLLVVMLIVLWIVIGRLSVPEQPIAFPHVTHVRDNEIPCQYCHAYARMSTVAGVPPVKKCMLCHLFQATDKEEVKKLKEYWENEEGIEWKRIYSLPDHVYFSHKRHVNGGVLCRECHGPVEEMKVITRYSSLEMGWCLECHKARGASVDCLTCHK